MARSAAKLEEDVRALEDALRAAWPGERFAVGTDRGIGSTRAARGAQRSRVADVVQHVRERDALTRERGQPRKRYVVAGVARIGRHEPDDSAD